MPPLPSLPQPATDHAPSEGCCVVDLAGSRSLPAELRALLAPPRWTPDGFLLVEGFGARADNVQHYPAAGGRMEGHYRPAAEVFDPESLASWRGRPVTMLHPEQRGERARLLHLDNATRLQVGSVVDAEPVRAHKLVKVILLLTNRAAIEAVLHPDPSKRMEELSAGYLRVLDYTPGVAADGTPYSAIQRQIRVNHVAMVEVGRAGPLARIATDSSPPGAPMHKLLVIRLLATHLAGATADGAAPASRWGIFEPGADTPLETCDTEAAALARARERQASADAAAWRDLDLGGARVRVHPDDAARLMDKVGLDRVGRAEADAAALRTERDQARAEVERLRGECDAAKAEAKRLRDIKDADALKQLREEAKALLPTGTAVDGMDARSLKTAVIQAVWKDMDVTGRPDVALDGLYEGAKRSIADDRRSVVATNAATRGGSTSSTGGAAGAAADGMTPRERWLQAQRDQMNKALASN